MRRMMTHTSQRFCLRWNNHQSNLLSVFDQLLHDESFVDVTLAVEGQLLRAHKMVLSACSPYFQALFVGHPDKHPIVILKDVPFADMRSLLDFMYRGEVSVDQDRLTAFLKVAESLRIKGLTEVNEEKCDLPSIASSLLSNSQQQQQQQQSGLSTSAPPPPPNLHRIHLSQPSATTSSTVSSNAKRCIPSPSNFNPYAAGNGVSSPYSQKRKRGRPRKLSGSSDTPSAASPEQDLNNDSDNRHSTQSNLSDSSYAHGPPDLLEVNMTEHSQNSPSSFSEEQNIGSPGGESTQDFSEEYCIKSEPNEDFCGPSILFSECKSPQLKENTGSRSQSQTPTNQSERYPPDKCQWKEILKRLKKPEISIRLENNEKQHLEETTIGGGGSCSNSSSSSNSSSGSNAASASKRCALISSGNAAVGADGTYSQDAYYGGDADATKNDVIWCPETQASQYVMDAEGDEFEDEEETTGKYYYEAGRSPNVTNVVATTMGADIGNNNSSPGDGASSAATAASISAAGLPASGDQTKPLDKSSVRRYCVQVAEHLFQCTLCYKTYTHISNFSRHFLSAHHGLRQEIPCPVCYRIFTRRDNMLTHMKQVHRITVTRGLATSLIQKLSASGETSNASTSESSLNSS